MDGISIIQPSFGAQAPVAANAGNDRPSLSIRGKGRIEPGKNAFYEAITDADKPKFKWVISMPDGTIVKAETRTVIVKPTQEGSLNLTLTVTDGKGKSNEVVWTVVASQKK
jgi:hypothetical protein